MTGQEEVWGAYVAYLREWAEEHKGVGFCGMSPACFGEWLDNDLAEAEGGEMEVDIDIGGME